MPYVTVKQMPASHQFSLDELIFGDLDRAVPAPPWKNVKGATRTYLISWPSDKLYRQLDVAALIRRLEQFNQQFEPLFQAERASLYSHYEIPKKNGKGKRPIDQPHADLDLALRILKSIFESDFRVLHHTAAYAYVTGRCTVDAARRHQANDSRWYLKTDFSNFFGSTTLEFTMAQFSQIFPFSEVVRYPRGKAALEKALSLCFLNGGLPQGTPISPLLTNAVMIPIDYELSNTLRDYEKNRYIYTRYADDITISSRYDFDYRKIVALIDRVLEKNHAPFRIKPEKTHYGSRSGRNWMLGLMVNKDNEITLGHRRKRDLRAWIFNYLTDRQNHIPTPVGELNRLQGNISYAAMVEPAWMKAVLELYGQQFGGDVKEMLRQDIAA